MDFVMGVMRGVVHDVTNRFSKNENQKPKIIECSKFDYYLQFVYKVLSWEDITVTLIVFLAINFLFSLVICFKLKLLAVLFLTIFIGFVGDACLENYQKYTNLECYDNFVELKEALNEIVLCLKTLRKESPSFFFITMTTFFLILSFIAKSLPGEVLFYFTFLAVFFIPLLLSKLPPEYQINLKDVLKSLRTKKATLAEEELIPFIADKDFEKDIDQDSLRSDKTADSLPNSLISGITSMPSFLDAEEEMELQEEDLLPQTSKAISITPGDLSSSSDSDSEHKGISFTPTHFNGDTSSEEEHFTKNLTFSNIDTMDNKNDVNNSGAVSGVLGDLINVGMNVIKSAVTSSNNNVPLRKDSSSDSEFEIINSEDASEH